VKQLFYKLYEDHVSKEYKISAIYSDAQIRAVIIQLQGDALPGF